MDSIFDRTKYPALSEMLDAPLERPRGPSSEPQRGNWFTSGLSAGVDQAQALSGLGLAAAGQSLGLQSVNDFGKGIAQRNFDQINESTGRPDLEGALPLDDPMKIPAWAGYQLMKQVPTMAGAALLARFLGPRAVGMIPEGVAAAAARVPAAIGGPGLRAGMSAAEQAAATQAGARLAGGVLAGTPVMYPQAVGSLYQGAVESGTDTPENARAALLAGVPYSLLESVQPAVLERFMAKGATGNLFQRVATRALGTAPTEAVTEGVQTAMENSFDPTLSAKEQASRIVDAAVTGGIVGGMFGGLTGIRKLKTTDPAQTSTDDLKNTVDEVLTGYDDKRRLLSEQQKVTSNMMQNQTVLPGTQDTPVADEAQVFDAQTRQLRPLANTTDEELQKALDAILRRRMEAKTAADFGALFGEQEGVAQQDADDRVMQNTILAEMKLRETRPMRDALRSDLVAEQQNIAAQQQDAQTVADFGSLFGGAGVSSRDQVDMLRGNNAMRNRQDALQAELDARVTDEQGSTPLFPGMELPEQRSPDYVPPTKLEQISEGKKQARAYAGTLLAPDVKPEKYGPRIKEQLEQIEAEDESGVLKHFVDRINAYYEADKNPPKDLKSVGQRIGYLDEQGRIRDLPAEIAQREIQGEALWRRAKQLGTAQEQAKAQKFQKDTRALAELSSKLQTALRPPAQPQVEQPAPVAENIPPVEEAAPPSPAEVWEDELGAFGTEPDISKRPRARLEAELAQIDERRAQFGGVGRDTVRAQRIRAELDRRDALAKPQPEQQENFLGIRVKPDVNTFSDVQQKVLKWADSSSASAVDFVARLSGMDEAGAVRAIYDEIQRRGKKKLPQSLINMGKNAGIVDAQGNPRDLQAELQFAQDRLAQLWGDARRKKTNGAEAQAYQRNYVKPLQETAERLQQALNPPAAQAAPEVAPEASAAPAPVAEPVASAPVEEPVAADEPVIQPPVVTPPEDQPPVVGVPLGEPVAVAPDAIEILTEREPTTLTEAVEHYKIADELALWLARNARNPSYRTIMSKVHGAIELAGVFVLKPGDKADSRIVNRFANGAQALYASNYTTDERAVILLRDAITEEYVVHELLHAATNTRIAQGEQDISLGVDSEYARAVQELQRIRAAMSLHHSYMENNKLNPELTDSNKVRASRNSVYELVTYAFASPHVREFMKLVPYKGSNIFTKFVEVMRGMFGVAPSDENALTAIIDVTERLTNLPAPYQTIPMVDLKNISRLTLTQTEAEIAEGDVLFNVRPSIVMQMPMQEANYEAALTREISRLPEGLRAAVISVRNPYALPQGILRAALRQNMRPSQIRGVLYKGSVYVVQDQVANEAELREVIAHEVFGHGATRAVFGPNRVENLSQIFQRAGGLEGLRNVARQYGVEAALNEYLPGRDLTVEDQAALTEELIAQVAGRNDDKYGMFLGAWASRFKQAFVAVLRTLGLNDAANRIAVYDANDLARTIVNLKSEFNNGLALTSANPVFNKRTDQDYVYIIHGGSDFDQIDLSNSGRGEPGNIRPLGPGLYGYVIDPSNTKELEQAVEGAKNYARKYGRGDKKLHVFRVPKNANASFVGMKSPVDGMSFSDKAKAQVKMERLPVDLTEISVLDPSVATRVGKLNLNATVSDLQQLLQDNNEAAFLTRSVPGMMESVRNVASSVKNFETAMNAYKATSFSDKFNEFHLYTSSVQHIVDFFGRFFTDADGNNLLANWFNSRQRRTVAEQVIAHLARKSHMAFEEVLKESTKAAKMIGDVMGASYREMDPRRTWAEHTWLHGNKNEDMLKKQLEQYNKAHEWLRQNSKKGLKVYDNFINFNEFMYYSQQGQSLYNIFMKDGEVPQALKDAVRDPMEEFVANSQQYDDPKAAREYWRVATTDLMTKIKDYIDAQRGLITTSDKKMRDKIVKSTGALLARIQEIESEQLAMQQAPYFHIGRFGQYVHAFDIKRNDDGTPDQAAVDKVAKAFADAKIDNVLIPKNARRANAFTRFENKGSWLETAKLLRQLEAQGLVKDIQSFDREQAMETTVIGYIPATVQNLMNNIRGTYFGSGLEGADAETVAKINREIRNQVTQFSMDLLPDTSAVKVLVSRDYVTGFSPDMVRAYVHRASVGGRSLSNMYASAYIAKASEALTGYVRAARSGNDPNQQLMQQRVVNELFKREAGRIGYVKANFVSLMRAFAHTVFLGMSPSYVVLQTTSLGTMVLPELSKKYGYVKSAKTMAKNTPTAFKIMTAIWQNALKAGIKELPDATITREVLEQKELGLAKSQIDLILGLVVRGVLDLGTQARELGRVAEGKEDSMLEQGLRWGAAAGYYSEMLTRLVATLSAKELHGGNGDDMFNYVEGVVRQTLFDFSQDNIARATGRNGMLGEMTPLVTQFQQYIYQVTEKLMRELHTGFINSASTEQEKKDARKFLLAHTAGMTMLTGVLGLPMAAVAAKVLDKLVDAWKDDDEEPFNSQVALRNWLNYVFGPQVGNVLARGLPRAAGFDVSRRAGEQDLLPFMQVFSKMLTDRRDWKESFKEWSAGMAGSAAGMVMNTLIGGQQILDGSYLEGATTLAPAFIRGPLQTYKLTRDGYVDKKGNALPIQADGWDYFYQLMGFNPAAKADVSEMDAAQSSLRGAMTKKASRIRKDLATALEKGDMVAAREAYDRALEFDRQNPAFDILDDFRKAYRARARERQKAQVYGTGLGVKPELADRTSFFDPQNY